MNLAISLETGQPGADRFVSTMTWLGYVVTPYPLYDQLADERIYLPDGLHLSQPAQWVKAQVQKCYDANGLAIRNAPDWLVVNPHLRRPAGVWIAEVKAQSAAYKNLSVEVVQLLQNFIRATRLGEDLSYVYVPRDGHLRRRDVREVVYGGGRTLHCYPGHPSNERAFQLIDRLGLGWTPVESKHYYDPFTIVPAHELAWWPVIGKAEDEHGEQEEVMPWEVSHEENDEIDDWFDE